VQVQQILKMKADDAVVTVPPDMAVAEAVKLLSSRRIGAVVVSSDGSRPLGILSERDIVRELGRRGPECLDGLVSDMMTSKLTTCTRHDATDAVLGLMTEGRFRHVPVIEDDRMVGLISIGDVVKARLSELSMERDALQDMVMGH
jgi:CBS domain-containing protein